MNVAEDVERWHQLTAAMLTQDGEIYIAVIPLPIKVNGQYAELVVRGIGWNNIVAEVRVDLERTAFNHKTEED